MTLLSKRQFLLMPSGGRPLLVLALNARLSERWARDQGFARAQWEHVGGEWSLRGITGPGMYVIHDSFVRRSDRMQIMQGLDIAGVVRPFVLATRLDLAKMRVAALIWGPRPANWPVTWSEVLGAIERYAVEKAAADTASELDKPGA